MNDGLLKFSKRMKKLLKVGKKLNRRSDLDTRDIVKAFALNAFLLDDNDNNGGIWLDLYKPFGNGNIIGDIRSEIFDNDEDYISIEENKELEMEYCELIYLILPHWIKTVILNQFEEYRNA